MTVPMCCVVGPFIEYVDYKDFLEENGWFKKIPSSIYASLVNFAQSLGSLVLNMMIPIYAISIYNMHTARFTEASFLMKQVYIYFAMFAAWCMYYVAWKLTDSAISISGISYDEKTKKFDNIVSCDIWNIELGDSAKTMIDSWNH